MHAWGCDSGERDAAAAAASYSTERQVNEEVHCSHWPGRDALLPAQGKTRLRLRT